jgi:hypothetical protein
VVMVMGLVPGGCGNGKRGVVGEVFVFVRLVSSAEWEWAGLFPLRGVESGRKCRRPTVL